MQQSLIYGAIIKHVMVVISSEIEYHILQTVKHTEEFLAVISTPKEEMGLITPTFIKGRNNSKNGRKVKFEHKSCEYIKHLYYYTCN